MAVAERVSLAGLLEALEPVLPHALEQAVAHPRSVLLDRQERLLHQGPEQVERVVAVDVPRRRRPPRPPRGCTRRRRPTGGGGAPAPRPTGARSSSRWRPAASAGAAAPSRRRASAGESGRPARRRSARRASTRTRAAASSIASGIPSRSRQICATAGALPSLSANPGRALTARSTNRRAASDSPSDSAPRPRVDLRQRQRRHAPTDLARRRRAARGSSPAPSPHAGTRRAPQPPPRTPRSRCSQLSRITIARRAAR